MKHFTDQEIADALKKVPKLIQDELSSGEDTAVVLAQMGQKYKLHVDQIGTLAELNRNMLLGLVGPSEFLQDLVTAGISDKDAREIMKEINEKIFVPLRKEEESKGIQAESVVKPATETKPMIASPAPTPVQVAAARPIPTPIMPSQQPRVPTAAPAAARVAASLPSPRLGSTLGDVVRSILPGAKPPESSTLLEDHEEPHIEFAKVPVTPVAPVAFVAPAVAAAPRVVPPVPVNLPGAMPQYPRTVNQLSPSFQPEPPRPVAMPVAMPAVPEAAVAPRPAPAPLAPVQPRPVMMAPAAPYASDPYREAVDEPPVA
jgi:hypothetical protein